MIHANYDVTDRGKRLFAYLIDMLIIFPLVYFLFYNFLGFDEIWTNYINRGDDIEPRIQFLKHRNHIRETVFIIWVIYATLLEASARQGTIGKMLMRIQVVDESGKRLSLKKSINRNFSKVISYYALGIGFLWILWDKNSQGWHDKLAKTYVVYK